MAIHGPYATRIFVHINFPLYISYFLYNFALSSINVHRISIGIWFFKPQHQADRPGRAGGRCVGGEDAYLVPLHEGWVYAVSSSEFDAVVVVMTCCDIEQNEARNSRDKKAGWFRKVEGNIKLFFSGALKSC